MLSLWDSDEFVDDNTLTVNVNRLRKTLEDAGLHDCIITHKGKGYAVNE
jgi:DNA-binding winged helix-turn-helix (wHTH) protein